jgi:hypothetical protein
MDSTMQPPPSYGAHHSNIASLTALSQAALRAPAQHESPPHSITISLQNHTPMHHPSSTPPHGGHLHQQTASSLASSAVSSPNEMRVGSQGSTGSSGAGSTVTTSAASLALQNIMGTPKATSTSLYSNLLLQSMTPRMLPRSTPTGGIGQVPTMQMNGGQSVVQQQQQQQQAMLSLPHHHPPSTSARLPQSQIDTSLSSSDINDDTRDTDDSSRGHEVKASPSFAMLFALGMLPAVQRDIHAVLSAQDGAKNRDRLRRVEEIFATYAAKVESDEISLQL